MLKARRHFGSRLRIAYLMLLLIIVVLAWLEVETFNWYRQGLSGIAEADSVIQQYRNISRLTLAEAERVNERVNGGDYSGSGSNWQMRLQQLEESLSGLHQGGIGDPGASNGATEGANAVSASELEQAVRQYILASASIHQAIDENRIALARQRWADLQRARLEPELDRMLHLAIEQQLNRIHERQMAAMARIEYAISLVPFVLPLFVLLTVLTIWRFSRGLHRSITELQSAAEALAEGEYDQHVPKTKYEEFSSLSQSLNSMARKLLGYRENLQETAVRLEKMVDERTRELQVSNRKLAMADAERRKLLADISHEFRTPLTVIRGESDLVLRGAQKSAAEYRIAVEKILDQADLATRLVDDLLFIARADAGEPRLRKSSVLVVPLITSVCAQFEAMAKQKGITIEQYSKDGSSRVFADAGRLRQVIAILVDNALRYSKPGGTVEVSAVVADGQISIVVRDYGIGLSEEDSEHAFDRFYRGSHAEEHARGTGLGLPVAKAIVEAHNGVISLEGTLGEGAIATVVLPTRSEFRDVA